MVKYNATGLVHYTDETMAGIHGFVFVANLPSNPNFKYHVSSFFLGWKHEIFSGYPKDSYLQFKHYDGHGMDGASESLRLENETEPSITLISGSETIIMDRPLIQNPAKFVLPHAMRFMCSLSGIDNIEYFDLTLHKD